MAKLALFVVLFCLVQVGLSARMRREAEDPTAAQEITTESFLGMVQSGLKTTFSEDNLNKARTQAEQLGGQVKEGFQKAATGLKNLFKTDETTAAPATP